MSYKHSNLFVMLPYEQRDKVAGYFDLDVVGEEYANLLGNLTDMLAEYAILKNDTGKDTVIATILRAGQTISNRLALRLPDANVVKINMRRNIHTLKPFVAWDEFSKIDMPEKKKLIITDPALATGGSVLKALELAMEHGFKEEKTIILSMFGGELGLEKVLETYPDVKIYLTHMADGIREDGYLLPYNGDTGDRLYGIRENEYVL